MKLFDNKKTQPNVKSPKQDSSEIDELRKQNKKLKDEISWLSRSVHDLDVKIHDLDTDNAERWEIIENRLKDYIDRSAPGWIEEHIDMAKIEDKVLLKVVKATFNNYKDEKK